MNSPREATKEAVAALMALDDHRSLGLVNHLLEDAISTNRVRQVLAFLSEITLQMGSHRFHEAMNGTDDAVEGLGWILRSCHEALEILQDINATERQRIRKGVSPTD